MAKEDFCFTYYDGDAARDMSHMNRTERGAYTDLLMAQRKKGRLSIDDIKKVLSKDFEDCWPSLEWVLIKDENELFYVEWLETSVEKTRENSKKNKERIEKYWHDKKSDELNQTDTTELPRNENGNTNDIPTNNHGIESVEPLGDGYGDEYKGVSKKGGKGGKPNYSFEIFWHLYDKKVGSREKIKKKWVSLSEQDRQRIIDYLPRYIESQPDKTFRKNPETFLNNHGWEDEIITSKILKNGKSHSSKPGRSEINDQARAEY